MGYKVLEAASGEEAMGVIQEYEAEIDVLLTDVIMRGGNGPELADSVLRSRPGAKVLFMSGYTDNVVLQRAMLTPGTAFLQKPFTREALAAKMRDVLGQGGSPRAAARTYEC